MEAYATEPLGHLYWRNGPPVTAGITLANRGAALGRFGFSVSPTFRHSTATAALHRRLLARSLGLPVEALALQRQVHGIEVTEGGFFLPPRKSRVSLSSDTPVSDILLTDRPRLLLTLSVADCVPVLLVGPGVIGAVHSGWRGTAAGAAPRAVEAIKTRYGVEPSELSAWVGPCAGGESYEVGAEVAAAFDGYPGALRPSWRPGHQMLDLSTVISRQLRDTGVPAGGIALSGLDTIADRRFHSYRRDGRDSGRMAAWIMLH